MVGWQVTPICLFSLLYLGAVGLAVTLAFADMGGGWERDHPPAGRQMAGVALPFLTAMALVVPVVALWRLRPVHWTVLSACALLPFALLAVGWAVAWRTHRPAVIRRRWGSGVVQAGVVGAVVSSILLFFVYEGPVWRSGVVLALQAGTAGTLGALLALAIFASPGAREDRDVATKVPRGVLAGGLLLLALSFGDVFTGWLQAGRPVGALWLMLVWVVGGMVIPGAGALLSLPRWPIRPWVWPAIFAMAVVGLGSATHLLFQYGQLVPPVLQSY